MEPGRDPLADLNEQYERIFALMHLVDDAIAEKQETERIAHAIEDFARSAETQLAEEEKFLLTHCNPEFRAHAAQHRFFAREMGVLRSAFHTGQLSLVRNIVIFLQTWLAFHLATACRKYGETLPGLEFGTACNR